MPRRGHLRTALAAREFRRLFAARLAGQFGDGVFQASLAGVVLFNPERQAHAADIAAGFTVLLVPYSIVGPFAGVLLDRWWRQRVLVFANLARALAVLGVAAEIGGGLHGLPFFASALVVVATSRFVLSALSASLPHVVAGDGLVTANALSTTTGGIVTALGGATAIGLRELSNGTVLAYALIAAAAAAPYLLAAVAARGFDRTELGPDDVQRSRRESARDVVVGLAAGARHVRARPYVLSALLAIGVHRLCYGVTTVCTLLLYRNYFHGDGLLRSGLAGLGQVVAAVAIGGTLAAAATPSATRRIGYRRWLAALLAGAGAVEVSLGLVYRLGPMLVAAVLLGFAAQGIKISVDTLVQRHVDDEFRGRVFSFYDALFNLTLVAAAVLTAAALPENGRSPAAVVVIGAAYVLTAGGYLWLSRRVSPAVRATG